MKLSSVKSMTGILIIGLLAVLVLSSGVVGEEHEWPDRVRIGVSDVPAMDTILKHASFLELKEMGAPIKRVFLKSDQLADQAVVSGQTDIGSGTPYSVVQQLNKKKGRNIRLFFQTSILEYIPVVRKSKYQSWEDLDGKKISVHSQGSGTEAQARMAEQIYGIDLEIQYVPGTEVRGNAMLQGRMDASIIGLFTYQHLQNKQPGKWKVLPLKGVNATDDALYAREEWIKENEEFVTLLCKVLMRNYRKVTADPTYVYEAREEYDLVPDMAPEVEETMPVYWNLVARRNLKSLNGGGIEAAKNDLDFYKTGGQLKGEDLKVEDFWYLEPLNKALEDIGKISISYEE